MALFVVCYEHQYDTQAAAGHTSHPLWVDRAQDQPRDTTRELSGVFGVEKRLVDTDWLVYCQRRSVARTSPEEGAIFCGDFRFAFFVNPPPSPSKISLNSQFLTLITPLDRFSL